VIHTDCLTDAHSMHDFLASAVVWMISSLFRDFTQRRWLVTDISRKPLRSVFKGQSGREELNCLTLEAGTDKFSRNAANQLQILRKVPE